VADFIGPVVGWLKGVLKGADMGEMDAFAEIRESWTGVIINWPSASVMGRTSAFDGEIVGGSHSRNELTVKFGVNGSDPDQVVRDATAYMKAIDAAIAGAEWLPTFSRVYVSQHDYGPLFERNGNFAKFPELHLMVEVYE
jgi:hypothetical protein